METKGKEVNHAEVEAKSCITISIRGMQEMVEVRIHFELARNKPYMFRAENLKSCMGGARD